MERIAQLMSNALAWMAGGRHGISIFAYMLLSHRADTHRSRHGTLNPRAHQTCMLGPCAPQHTRRKRHLCKCVFLRCTRVCPLQSMIPASMPCACAQGTCTCTNMTVQFTAAAKSNLRPCYIIAKLTPEVLSNTDCTGRARKSKNVDCLMNQPQLNLNTGGCSRPLSGLK